MSELDQMSNDELRREIEALRLALQRQDAILNRISDLAWTKDRDFRFVAVNQALAEFTGHTREEMIGTRDADYFPDEIADGYVAGDRHVLETGTELRIMEEIADPSGRRRWIETIKCPVFDASGAIVGTTGIARDITALREDAREREGLARRLREEHQRLNDTIANVPGVVWEEWFDGRPRFVSEALEKMLGYSTAEYLRTCESFLELVHPEDVATVEASTARMIALGTGGLHEFRMRAQDGTEVWCESHCSVIFDSNGRPVGLRGVAIDVTRRKKAEEALRESEAYLREIVDLSPAMLWMSNAGGKVTFASRRFIEWMGLNAEELHGDRWLERVHPEDRSRVVESLRTAIERRGDFQYEMRFDARNACRELLAEARPRFSADGAFLGHVGSVIDLTDVHRLERRLEEERRMASLGRLAATIAHEVNNVLMGIQTFTTVVESTREPALQKRAAENIRRCVERGGRVTADILRFTGGARPSFERVDVAPWLRALSPELTAILGNGVALEIRASENLAMTADPVQMQQVLVNLAVNARDAMDGAGSLRITAASVASAAGPRVCLTVTDDGHGIPPELVGSIFEPFFTTKLKGTGLGLAIAHEIVRVHEGEIRVETGAGGGTTFEILVPAAAPEPAEIPRPASPAEPRSIPAGRILLIEDDEAIAEGLAALLSVQGTEVEIAPSGAAGIERAATFQPDLVILDIGLPDIPGTVVFERLREKRPDLPILISTGHASAGSVQRQIERDRVAYLMKPYEMTTLLDSIASVLGPAHATG
ncbi:MAG: hybrid sensor histidine kinase/response regulator [Thermoanaerobaculia bacterium]